MSFSVLGVFIMTISKKLAFLFMCALGMQCISQAYDAVGLKAEVTQILDFIKELDKQHSAEICTVTGWLETHIAVQYNGILNDLDIITIAKTVSANMTIDAKLTIISQLMVAKAEQAQQSAEQEVVWAKENAKQQVEWVENNAKREAQWAKEAAESEKKAIRAKARQEKKFLIEEARKWARENLYRGGLAAVSTFMIVAMLIRAIQYHHGILLEKAAEMIADAFDKQHSKQTIKK